MRVTPSLFLLPQHKLNILFRTPPIFPPWAGGKGGDPSRSLPLPLPRLWSPPPVVLLWGSLEALWDPFGAVSMHFGFLFGWPRFGIDFGAQMGAKIMIPVGG